jgi:Transposase
MSSCVAGVDVHKRMLAVAVADVEVEGEWRFERRQFGTSPTSLRELAAWLVECDVAEVVMESTAQYWRPVWEALERHWQPTRRAGVAGEVTAGALHLAQAQSNHGPRGRKRDFPDAERLVKRLVAHELTLSFVPDVTQRLWRRSRAGNTSSPAIGCNSRIGWNVCWKKRTSRSRVSCRICSAKVRDGCCVPSPTAKPMRPLSSRSAARDSTPRPISYVTRLAPVPLWIRFTGGLSP